MQGYKAYKKVDWDDICANNQNNGAVISYSNQGITSIETRTQSIVVRQTPNGVRVFGIEEQHVVLQDGRGGILIVKKMNAESLSAGGRGNGSLKDAGYLQFFHITREALLRDPDNPEIRVITSAEINRFSLSQRDQNRIAALSRR